MFFSLLPFQHTGYEIYYHFNKQVLANAVENATTHVTIHAICPPVTYRDGVLNSGFESTIVLIHGHLDQLLVMLRK